MRRLIIDLIRNILIQILLHLSMKQITCWRGVLLKHTNLISDSGVSQIESSQPLQLSYKPNMTNHRFYPIIMFQVSRGLARTMYKHHAQTGVQVQRQTYNPSDITVCYTPMRLEGHSVSSWTSNSCGFSAWTRCQFQSQTQNQHEY